MEIRHENVVVGQIPATAPAITEQRQGKPYLQGTKKINPLSHRSGRWVISPYVRGQHIKHCQHHRGEKHHLRASVHVRAQPVGHPRAPRRPRLGRFDPLVQVPSATHQWVGQWTQCFGKAGARRGGKPGHCDGCDGRWWDTCRDGGVRG